MTDPVPSSVATAAAVTTATSTSSNNTTAATTAAAAVVAEDPSIGKKRARGSNAGLPHGSGHSIPSTAAVAAAAVSSSSSASLDAVTIATLQQTAIACYELGYNGLFGVLTSNTKRGSTGGGGAGGELSSLSTLADFSGRNTPPSSFVSATSAAAASLGVPSVSTVAAAARKAVADSPPWCHWSKMDMAPQLKSPDPHRLALQQAVLRGYRMARANIGCSNKGSYYYECWLDDEPGPPSANQILQQLPPTARLGPGLKEALEKAVKYEQQQQQQQQQQQKEETSPEGDGKQEEKSSGKKKRKHGDGGGGTTTGTNTTTTSKDLDADGPPQVGGHVRVGWSMRTGDLQAPVGYDKWSYGIRSVNGAIIHKSQRQDNWGGLPFEPGDVIGCGIHLDPDDQSQNHVRFFKNGVCLGQFVLTKGKREGGEAFQGIEPGTYYPAVSAYMGGSVTANFGPTFVYPPRKLPPGLRFQPMSDLAPPPLTADEAVAKMTSTLKLFRRSEVQQAVRELIQAEAEIVYDAYQEYNRQHLERIREERVKRELSTGDLDK